MVKYERDTRDITNWLTLDQLQQEITRAYETYPELRELRIVATNYYDTPELRLEFERPQTEEERRKEELRIKREEEYERKQYEKLRKKFGDK